MRKLALLLLTYLLLSTTSIAKTITVDDDGPAIHSSIQNAIAAASDGDTIIVRGGSYSENINFNGKKITIKACGAGFNYLNLDEFAGSWLLNSNDPCFAPRFDFLDDGVINFKDFTIFSHQWGYSGETIINGGSSDVVTFNSGEDVNSVLEGITITGGRYGINCENSSSPKILNCIISSNQSYGLRCHVASAIVSGCRIDDNGAYGVYGWNELTLSNCIIANNSSGGVTMVTFSSNEVRVINCTIVQNGGVGIAGWFDKITNCIIWDNSDDLILKAPAPVTYSCIEKQYPGLGNIYVDPIFVNSDSNDFHLWYESLCIDAGDPNSNYSNEPGGGGGRVNIGAYGNTEEASSAVDNDGDGIPDGWERYYWPDDDPNLHDPNDDPDVDDFNNLIEYVFRYDPTQYTSESLKIYCDLYFSQIDPTKGQTLTIEYWLNKDADEVQISITQMGTNKLVRTISEPNVAAGLNQAVWDGTDANSAVVIEPNFFDVNIVAESNDPCAIDIWSSPKRQTKPEMMNVVVDTNSMNNFDPYANIPVQIDFDFCEWGKVWMLEICNPDDYQTVIRHLIKANRLINPGHHTAFWDGRDDNGEIHEGDFAVYYNKTAVSVNQGAVLVFYDYPAFGINNLLCNSYRIIPIYNEVSTITYTLTRSSTVTIDITDPDGSYFGTLLDNVFQTAGPQQVVWDGKDDSGLYATTVGDYTVTITAADPNHPEIKTERTGSIIACR